MDKVEKYLGEDEDATMGYHKGWYWRNKQTKRKNLQFVMDILNQEGLLSPEMEDHLKVKMMESKLEENIQAIDVSYGQHGPEGYPKINIPDKLQNLISVTLSNRAILGAWKYEDNSWTIQVTANGFSLRNDDLKKLIKSGLVGIQFEQPKSLNLYFKTQKEE